MSRLVTPPDQTARDQATDPARSAIVQAPAGAGKTTLLANRFIALLETATRPEEILAITFTIKAAAEMKERVLELLEADTPLAVRIRQRAETLGWQLLDNPNVLKIQTIDSFALEIAGRAPGNYNLAGFEITENPERYFVAAAESLITRLANNDAIADLVAEFLAYLDNDADNLVRLVSTMLAKRDQWLSLANGISQQSNEQHISTLLSETVAGLRADQKAALDGQLSDIDRRWFTSFSTEQADWSSGISPLMTKAGTLRKKIPTDLVPVKETRKLANLWLDELHAKDLSALLEGFAKLPRPDDIEATGQPLQTCCINLALAAVELEQSFRRDGITDFTGLLLNAKHALRDREGEATDLALLLDYRIKHILVDEFQDTSRGQLELFEMLIEPWQEDSGNTFFAVGDPMQSIYRFRDADVQIFKEVKASGIGPLRLTSCDLTANFRSDPTLVSWVNELFVATQDNAGSTYNPAQAMQPPNSQAQMLCQHFETADAELASCINHLEKLLARDDESSIALLCRSRTHLSAVLKAMNARQISWQATDIDLLESSPIVNDLMSSLKILITPRQRLPWFALLRSPLFGASLDDLLDLSDEYIPAQLATSSRPYQRRLYDAYLWAERMLHELSIREVLEGFWQRCGGADAYSDNDITDAQLFLDLLDSIPVARFDLKQVDQEVARLFAQSRSRSRLHVLTIHKAKGLEFDHVVVPSLERATQSDSPSLLLWRPTHAGLLMGLKGDACHAWLASENRQAAKSETLRILYVACTRAKTSLYLSFMQANDKRPGGLANYLADFATAGEPAVATTTPDEAHQSDFFGERLQYRLPQDYAWQPPAPTPLITNTTAHAEPDRIAHRFEVEVGNLVHKLLDYCAKHSHLSLEESEVKRLLTLWADNASGEIAQVVTTQVRRLLDSDLGRWALTPHPQHESEAAYQVFENGTLSNIVIDRMFVENGIRWILDYKTGHDAQVRVNELRERYQPQMLRYAKAMQHLYPEPIRIALLLVDPPQLEELDVSSLDF